MASGARAVRVGMCTGPTYAAATLRRRDDWARYGGQTTTPGSPRRQRLVSATTYAAAARVALFANLSVTCSRM